MNDLRELLDRAARLDTDDLATGPTVQADTLRGRRALAQRRRVRAAAILGGVAAVAVLGYATAAPMSAVFDSPSSSDATTATAGSDRSDQSRRPGNSAVGGFASGPVDLAKSKVTAGSFRFGLAPQGWHVSDSDASTVMFAPDGTNPTIEENDFVGKLMIFFGDDSTQTRDKCPTVKRADRTFFLCDVKGRYDVGLDAVMVRTRSSESPGWITVQYPSDAGFTQQQLVDLTDSVEVLGSAAPSVG
ncbi:MAG: hypothetical protein ACRCYU_15865 [Nocardioides sp.]